jgi:hypothetical protein
MEILNNNNGTDFRPAKPKTIAKETIRIIIFNINKLEEFTKSIILSINKYIRRTTRHTQTTIIKES